MIYRLSLTAEELQVIGAALGALPFNQVVKVVNNLQEQVRQNEVDADAPKADDLPEDATDIVSPAR